ncbi:MAG: feruloyl-CoA synthase [Acidobacteriota bacterium]|jgi:feruloyl-CoA synthase
MAPAFRHWPGDTRVLPADVIVEREADGTIRARSPHALGPYPERITDRLNHWAVEAPDRPFLAARSADGAWCHLAYADAHRRVRSVAQALLTRRLSHDRTVVILSGNSIEHAVVALAAMYCGVPYAPVAPAYSLQVRDRTALGRLCAVMRPGLVFADDGPAFEPALRDVVRGDIEIVTSIPLSDMTATPLESLEATTPTAAVDDAHARVSAGTIAKVLFTSGSTGRPKGVINTQRMLCANQEQLRTVLAFLGDAPPVLCDWLPWNHTFGGNHNFGIALYNGGTLYIDEGRPLPGRMERTLANLREVAPTAYFNVPRGFELLLPELRSDPDLERRFFSRLQALFFAAAGLRPEIADGMQERAIATLGRPVAWITGLGATESAPFALCTGALLSTTTHVGVPVPGLELKAAPMDGILEARLRGPNITPGYWADDELTRAAFDDEGFYRMGDAIAPADPGDLSRGFSFRGRINEDFKLSTGTWVRVGDLRARLLAALGGLAQDVVITGQERDRVGALLFPNVIACRTVAGVDPAATVADVVCHPSVRETFANRLAAFNEIAVGSSTTVFRAVLLDTPPSFEAAEITDKGSINQRAILAHRSDIVDALYAGPGDDLLM